MISSDSHLQLFIQKRCRICLGHSFSYRVEKVIDRREACVRDVAIRCHSSPRPPPRACLVVSFFFPPKQSIRLRLMCCYCQKAKQEHSNILNKGKSLEQGFLRKLVLPITDVAFSITPGLSAIWRWNIVLII